MRILIPSYGRAGTISTPLLLDGFDWQIVVHDDFEARAYRKRFPLSRIIVSGVELGIAKQRNWILDHCVEQGEWFVFMDDNIKEFWSVNKDQYNKESLPVESFNHAFWDKLFRANTNPARLNEILEETQLKAEAVGAHFAGFATTDNPFFRKKKWRETGFVCTKTALVKKNSLRFDERFYAKDDVDFSAANLERYGRTLVNNYLFPKAAHHQSGGIGNKFARKVYTQRETQLLVEKWPDICGFSKRRNGNIPEEVRFK